LKIGGGSGFEQQHDLALWPQRSDIEGFIRRALSGKRSQDCELAFITGDRPLHKKARLDDNCCYPAP
jgi:hypothetical protein